MCSKTSKNIIVIVLCKVLLIAVEVAALTDDDSDEVLTTAQVMTAEPVTGPSNFELAANLDAGIYTTQIFPYMNDQYGMMMMNEVCYDQYAKCLVTQGNVHPVCAVNDYQYKPHGYVSFTSYCDVFFDNCYKGYRYWRILDVGKCSFYYYNQDFEVSITRRFVDSLPFFLQKLARSVFKI